MVRWVKMTEYPKRRTATTASKALRRSGWGTKITKHKTRLYNGQPSRYSLFRSESRRKK